MSVITDFIDFFSKDERIYLDSDQLPSDYSSFTISALLRLSRLNTRRTFIYRECISVLSYDDSIYPMVLELIKCLDGLDSSIKLIDPQSLESKLNSYLGSTASFLGFMKKMNGNVTEEDFYSWSHEFYDEFWEL